MSNLEIHKLTKDGKTLYPATTTDAVVHPNLRAPMSNIITEYNLIQLYPDLGEISLDQAIELLTEKNLIKEGIKLIFKDVDGIRNVVLGPDGWIDIIPEDLDLITKITWSDLKNLRDSGGLNPGGKYRIIDYRTIISNAFSGTAKSAEHDFDIIVTAVSNNMLNECAQACLREGKTYFNKDDISSWQLWYCLDNNTDRYIWANSTSGKGVIYRMIDNKNNDCPYDFKNIMFYNETIIPKNNNIVFDYYYYTFSSVTDRNITGQGRIISVVDASVMNNSGCYNNTIGLFIDSSNKYNLPYNNIFVEGIDSNTPPVFRFINNTLGNNCTGNTIYLSSKNNKLGNYCNNNILGTECESTTLGNNCINNRLDSCLNVKLGNYCSDNNILGTQIDYNKFNTLEDECVGNTLNKSAFNTLFNCRSNTIQDSNNNLLVNSNTNNLAYSNYNQLNKSITTNIFKGSYNTVTLGTGNRLSNSNYCYLLGENIQNTIEDGYDITLGIGSNENYLGSCSYITLGKDCNNNKLINKCINTSLRDNIVQVSLSGVRNRIIEGGKTLITSNDEFYNDGSNELVPIKHPDLSTQPSILPYKFMGNYVYEQLVSIIEVKLHRVRLEVETPLFLDNAVLIGSDTTNTSVKIVSYNDGSLILDSDLDEYDFVKLVYTESSGITENMGGSYNYGNSKDKQILYYTTIDNTVINFTVEVDNKPISNTYDSYGIMEFYELDSLSTGCFTDNNKIEHIILPNGITTIGYESFLRCKNLKSIEIPSGVTNIEDRAFDECTALESIEIPSSVTNIGESFFGSGIKNVICRAITPPEIVLGTFMNPSSIIVYVPAESIDVYKSADYWKDCNILAIPNS